MKDVLNRVRPVAVICIAAIVALVWMAYAYTGTYLEEGLRLLKGDDAEQVRDGVVQVLVAALAFTPILVALQAIGQALGKLCDEQRDSEAVAVINALLAGQARWRETAD